MVRIIYYDASKDDYELNLNDCLQVINDHPPYEEFCEHKYENVPKGVELSQKESPKNIYGPGPYTIDLFQFVQHGQFEFTIINQHYNNVHKIKVTIK